MTASAVQIVETLGRPNVLVVGDLILDRYVWGDAERVSQEAPVILLRADRREERLGGAASVARLLSALGASVWLAGVLGADEPADRCRRLLDENAIDHELVLTDPGRPSTLKERYIGRAQHRHPQQMMRVDYEVRDPLSDALCDRLCTGVEALLDRCDIVLVSDYDKGACTERLTRRLIDACRKRGVRVLVDPIRGGSYRDRYWGCSAMTPNRLEAGLATGVEIRSLEDAYGAAERLMIDLDMQVGLVTLDRDGMALVERPGVRRHFPVRPRTVYDITGAGDMVLAAMGMTLAAGHGYADAIVIANAAGGLEVEKIGVAPVTRDEIVRDLLHGAGRGGKLLSRETLSRQLERDRRDGRTVVFTNGCFDLLHAGHVQYLRECREQGDVLVVGLNTDASVRRLNKGPDRPINDEGSRAAVLGALECVDYICLFGEETPEELIRAVRPDVLVKGADYRPEDVVGREFVESLGGRLHLAKLAPGQSTTGVLRRIRSTAA